MRFPQVTFAGALLEALQTEALGRKVHPSLGASGLGVHWHCDAALGERSVCIACFGDSVPEYYSRFSEKGEKRATGRSGLIGETVRAAIDWISGQDLPSLYAAHAFVDRWRRDLEMAETNLLRHSARLQSVPRERGGFDVDAHLRFSEGDRQVEIDRRVGSAVPGASFRWDKTEMFRATAADWVTLSVVLTRWLCDRAMPSALAAEFPEIALGKIAHWYEIGKPIEGEFYLSWERMESWYGTLPGMSGMAAFVRELRSRGFDRDLRAGQSMWILVLSRSRRHGLAPGQPSLGFALIPQPSTAPAALNFWEKVGEETKIPLASAAFDPRVEAALRRLIAHPIG